MCGTRGGKEEAGERWAYGKRKGRREAKWSEVTHKAVNGIRERKRREEDA